MLVLDEKNFYSNAAALYRAYRAEVAAVPHTDFKSSDTPEKGPGSTSGHAHEAPHNHKEIA